MSLDIIQYTISRRARGLLVPLDQEKAFDYMEHEYIFGMLDAFGFPKNFVQLITAMYTNIESTLFLDSRESKPFALREASVKAALFRQFCLFYTWNPT